MPVNEPISSSPSTTPPHSGHVSFTRRLGAFVSATLISRILGYLRDALVAAYFGGGAQTDAFYAAFKIPNLLRRFLGEGSLTAAFVPVFTETIHKKGHDEARRLLQALLSGLLIVLVVLVALGILFAPQLTLLSSWGFVRDPEKFELATRLTRLIFPFLLFISLAALLTAVLNSCGRFFVPAVAPSGLSIGEIVFMLVLASRFRSPIEGLAVSAVVGVALHFLWQVPSLYREGYTLRPARPFAHPEVKRIVLLMGPTIIGLCADQVNSFVDQLCASFLRDGSITALYNSNRLMQLPLALFGVAVASVSLPALSKAAAADDPKEFKSLISFSVRISNFVLIPSVMGLLVLGYPITQLLFERGKFLPVHTQLTYWALVPCALGLPAYSATKVLASAFYARKNTKTPMNLAFLSMFVNVILDVALMWRFEVAGLTFATTAASWVQAALLFGVLRKQVGGIGGRHMSKSFLTASGAAVVMGLVLGAGEFWLFRSLPLLIRVPLATGLGAVTYLGTAWLIGAEEVKLVLASIKRRSHSVVAPS